MTTFIEHFKKSLVSGFVICLLLGALVGDVSATEHPQQINDPMRSAQGGPAVIGSYHRNGTSLRFEWEATGFAGPVTYKVRAQKPLGCGIPGTIKTTATSRVCEIVGNSGRAWGSCLSGEASDASGRSAKFMFCLGSNRSFFDYRSGFLIKNYWVGYVNDGSKVTPPPGLDSCFGDLTLSPIKVLCVQDSDATTVRNRIIEAQTKKPSWPVFPQPDLVWVGKAGDHVASEHGAKPITSSLHIGEWFVEPGAACHKARLRSVTEGQKVRYCAFATVYGPGEVSFALNLEGFKHSYGSAGPASGKPLGRIDLVWRSGAVARYTLTGRGGLSLEYEGRPFGKILPPPSISQS